MTTPTITRVLIACKHCAASTRSSMDVARAEGWRFFQGKSVTGKDLDDTVCPACAGTANDDDSAAATKSWRVTCSTCDWSTEDDRDDDGEILDAKAAKSMADFHECEKQVQIAPPSGDKWYDPFYVNDDGSIRKPMFAGRELS